MKDGFGPEYVVRVYDSKIGMRNVQSAEEMLPATNAMFAE